MGDGSLRVVRNGIGINETATIELLGIKVWDSVEVGGWTCGTEVGIVWTKGEANDLSYICP